MTPRLRQILAVSALAALASCATAPARRPPPDPSRVYTLAEVDTLPRLLNTNDIRRQIERNYLPLQDVWPHPAVAVYVVELGRDGRIQRSEVSRSAGSPRTDSAAIRVLARARFSPARIDTVAVRVRFDFPIEFGGPRRAPPPAPP